MKKRRSRHAQMTNDRRTLLRDSQYADGWTIEEMSTRSGISTVRISQMIAGTVIMDSNEYLRLSNIIDEIRLEKTRVEKYQHGGLTEEQAKMCKDFSIAVDKAMKMGWDMNAVADAAGYHVTTVRKWAKSAMAIRPSAFEGIMEIISRPKDEVITKSEPVELLRFPRPANPVPPAPKPVIKVIEPEPDLAKKAREVIEEVHTTCSDAEDVLNTILEDLGDKISLKLQRQIRNTKAGAEWSQDALTAFLKNM